MKAKRILAVVLALILALGGVSVAMAEATTTTMANTLSIRDLKITIPGVEGYSEDTVIDLTGTAVNLDAMVDAVSGAVGLTLGIDYLENTLLSAAFAVEDDLLKISLSGQGQYALPIEAFYEKIGGKEAITAYLAECMKYAQMETSIDMDTVYAAYAKTRDLLPGEFVAGKAEIFGKELELQQKDFTMTAEEVLALIYAAFPSMKLAQENLYAGNGGEVKGTLYRTDDKVGRIVLNAYTNDKLNGGFDISARIEGECLYVEGEVYTADAEGAISPLMSVIADVDISADKMAMTMTMKSAVEGTMDMTMSAAAVNPTADAEGSMAFNMDINASGSKIALNMDGTMADKYTFDGTLDFTMGAGEVTLMQIGCAIGTKLSAFAGGSYITLGEDAKQIDPSDEEAMASFSTEMSAYLSTALVQLMQIPAVSQLMTDLTQPAAVENTTSEDVEAPAEDAEAPAEDEEAA